MTTPGRAFDNVLPDFEQRVVETVIAMAEEVGWENVRLRVVAERLDIPLSEIASHFRDLDAVAIPGSGGLGSACWIRSLPSSAPCRRGSVSKPCCCAGSTRLRSTGG